MYFETYHVSCQTPTVVHYSVANPIRALDNTAPQAPGKHLSHPSVASKHRTQLVHSLTSRRPTLSTLTPVTLKCNRPISHLEGFSSDSRTFLAGLCLQGHLAPGVLRSHHPLGKWMFPQTDFLVGCLRSWGIFRLYFEGPCVSNLSANLLLSG